PRQSILDITTRLLELITEERGLVTFVSNFADVAVDALQRFSDSLRPLLERAQEQGEIRTDLTAEDIPRFLVMGIAALALPGTTPSIPRPLHRFALRLTQPRQRNPSSPLLTETEEDDLHTAISNAMSMPERSGKSVM
ncbi:hypothetical protein AB0H26_45435, partial [Streptomyces milbemycinicus]